MRLILAEALQQGLRQPFGPARHLQHLAEHRAQPDHDGDEAQRAAHAFLNGFDDPGQWHTGGDPHQQAGQQQSNEGVQFHLHHQKQQEENTGDRRQN